MWPATKDLDLVLVIVPWFAINLDIDVQLFVLCNLYDFRMFLSLFSYLAIVSILWILYQQPRPGLGNPSFGEIGTPYLIKD